MGSDAHYAEEAPAHAGQRRRVLDLGPAGDQRRVRRVRQRRLGTRTDGRAAAGPRRLPEELTEENLQDRARWSYHTDAGTGGPAPHQPVVDPGRLVPPGAIPSAHPPASTDWRRIPCVHVAYEDASAYAVWARAAPCQTEAEWEAAARGPWSRRRRRHRLGIGAGPKASGLARLLAAAEFPWRADPGYGTAAPVGSFHARTATACWSMRRQRGEWTTDWYLPPAHEGHPSPSSLLRFRHATLATRRRGQLEPAAG